MTFKEAVDEMKRLAGERPWSFEYRVGSFYSGRPFIRGYIDPYGHARESTTYAGAIRNVKIMLGLETEEADPAPEEGE